MKKIVAALLIFAICAIPLLLSCLCGNAFAFDTAGNDYSSDSVIITLSSANGTAELAEVKALNGFATAQPSEKPDFISFFGIGVSGVASFSFAPNLYTLTLSNQAKQYYLPQLDFLKVASGDSLARIEANILVSVNGSDSILNKIVIPNEVLYFVEVGCEADEVLRGFSENGCALKSFYGITLVSVSSIARYEGDEKLALYAIKVLDNGDVLPLVSLLNGEELAKNRNASLHGYLGYSAVESHYLDSEEESITAPNIAVGDVNEDGVLDNLDAALILKHDAAIEELPDIEYADVNGDGYVDNLDAAFILKYDAGL